MSADAVEGLRINIDELRGVLDTLSAEEWEAPSACDGWRIQDVVAHMNSSAKLMTGNAAPPAVDGDLPGAEDMAELLIADAKTWPWTKVREEFDTYTDGFLAALEAMQAEPIASAEANLGDLGVHPTHILANAFCFDTYCHLRHDMVGPATGVDRALPEPTDLHIRPGVDWMLAGLPQMCTAALAPVATAPIRLELTGPGGGTWVLGAVGDDGLVTVAEVDAAAETDTDATVSSSAHDFVSWATKRSAWSDACTVTGDEALAAGVLDAINII
jgi:uncharacterized protein (TIGR03083 family)